MMRENPSSSLRSSWLWSHLGLKENFPIALHQRYFWCHLFGAPAFIDAGLCLIHSRMKSQLPAGIPVLRNWCLPSAYSQVWQIHTWTLPSCAPGDISSMVWESLWLERPSPGLSHDDVQRANEDSFMAQPSNRKIRSSSNINTSFKKLSWPTFEISQANPFV